MRIPQHRPKPRRIYQTRLPRPGIIDITQSSLAPWSVWPASCTSARTASRIVTFSCPNATTNLAVAAALLIAGSALGISSKNPRSRTIWDDRQGGVTGGAKWLREPTNPRLLAISRQKLVLVQGERPRCGDTFPIGQAPPTCPEKHPTLSPVPGHVEITLTRTASARATVNIPAAAVPGVTPSAAIPCITFVSLYPHPSSIRHR